MLDVKKTGGNILEAFPCLSGRKSAVKVNNDDVINGEDDDVKTERSRVERLLSNHRQTLSHSEEKVTFSKNS